MRKLYSLVLMATALLIGTNAWASLHDSEEAEDVAKVQIDGGAWQYTDNLKEAFDAVGEGKTATIELLCTVHLSTPITMPKMEDLEDGELLNYTGQDITLNLGGFELSADKQMSVIRLIKGKLDIKNGTIKKTEVGSNDWLGRNLIVVTGAEDKSAKDWSVLTIEKDVILSITEDGQKNGTGIQVLCHNGCCGDASQISSSDVMYVQRQTLGNTTETKEAACARRFGFCTYYYPDSFRRGDKNYNIPFRTADNLQSLINANKGLFPMACGALADGPIPSDKDPQAPAGAYRNIQQASAFGVKIYIYGQIYAKRRPLQISGVINQKPVCTEDDAATKRNPSTYPNAPYYKYQYPYIYIGQDAKLIAGSDAGTNGIYGAGYGVFDIQGEVQGATGIYLKAGDVELKDAVVKSNCESYGEPSTLTANTVDDAGGSAIIVESNDAYAGNMGVNITGDTKVEGNGGYAIFEETFKADNSTTTSNITINGGTIQGGDQGAIEIEVSSKNKDVVTVQGGSVTTTGNTPVITVDGGTDINVPELFPNTSYHTTEVKVDNKTVIVVSQGAAPETQEGTDPTPWSWCAHNDQRGKSVAWTKIEADEIEANATVVLNELQIISGTKNNLQELTIKSGATLQVNHLIMNDYARIIVEAGGSLIIKGKQGIVAPKVENIVLKASETAQALFLFHPEVESNRHPNATVEFISNSITNNPFFSKQRFGIPTWKQLSSITTKNGGNNVQTAIASYSFKAHDWVDVSWINIDGKNENLNLIANPFEYYQMQHNTPNAGTVVTMTGELYGNTNPTLPILGNSWNGYANSYMAPIDGETLINLIPDEVDKSFQIYELENGAKGYWRPASNLDLANINPMQAFLIGNTKEAANVTVDYWDAVYTPITHEGKPNQAPARRSALSNITKAKMIVRGEGYKDGVVLAQDDQFSAAFDNSYDCRKYMNEGINLYVSADEKMGIFATDNLENTYVGFQSVNGGSYTIEFTDVQGEELTLIDHETGAKVAIVNGNVYEFTANGTNDYRFEVVGAAKLPTAIENAEAVKSAKGIYTITGQYLGEMSVWNSLPAGVYVVNGEKRVK